MSRNFAAHPYDSYGKKSTAKQQDYKDYARVLINPFSSLNHVRIPDISCVPTVAFKIEKNFLWTPVYAADTNSTTALVMDFNAQPSWSFANGPESTTAGTRFTSPASAAGYVGASDTSRIAALFSATRVVAGGIHVQFAGSDSNSQGQIRIVYKPYHSGTFRTATTFTFTSNVQSLVNTPDKELEVYMGPIVGGAKAVFKPLDLSYTDFMVPTDLSASDPLLSSIVVSLAGTSTTSVPPMHVKMVVHMEGIPIDDNAGLTGLDTFSNFRSLEYGFNTVSKIPSASPAVTGPAGRPSVLGKRPREDGGGGTGSGGSGETLGPTQPPPQTPSIQAPPNAPGISPMDVDPIPPPPSYPSFPDLDDSYPSVKRPKTGADEFAVHPYEPNPWTEEFDDDDL